MKKGLHPAGGGSKTRQSMAHEQNITQMLRRHIVQGNPLRGQTTQPKYGDFANGLDFHQALTRVREAEVEFLRLPSQLRSHCRNDVGNFLDLVSNPDRREELKKLGMIPEHVPSALERLTTVLEKAVGDTEKGGDQTP